MFYNRIFNIEKENKNVIDYNTKILDKYEVR